MLYLLNVVKCGQMFDKVSIVTHENTYSFQRTFQNGLNCFPYGGDCLPSADLPWMNQSIWLRVDVGERDRDKEREGESEGGRGTDREGGGERPREGERERE